ncbi:MAG: hypothetical protein V1781_02925 [Bacteroidota bacterium]
MSKHLFFIFYFLFSIFRFSFAGDNSPLGARSAAMANASVMFADVWSVQNNQAGLGFMKKISTGVFYETRFMLNELATNAAAVVIPIKSGTFGVSVSNFGCSLYSENKYGLSFGKSFGKIFSAGIQMDYLTTKISNDYENKNILAAEVGIQTKPLKNFTIGAHIFNPTRTRIAIYNDERIPTIIRFGFDYKFSEKVFIAVETEKDIDRKGNIKAGIEYCPITQFYLRAGVTNNLSCFGIGVNFKRFQLDISSSFHSVLGISSQVGLSYEFE